MNGTALKKRILIVAAHPDDEVLGCGATIAKLVQAGAEVFCCILGEGPLSRYKDRAQGAQEKDVAGVKTFIANAAAILGIKKTFTFQFPDNQFDTRPMLEIIKTITSVKDEVKPEAVFTHSRADLNVDHRRTFEAVLTACRPLAGETVCEIYSWENPSSTEWNYPNTLQPNMFVDVGATLDKKIEALKCYETEVLPFPHPRSEEALRALAAWRGATAGCKAAEAFEIVRIIKA